MLDDDVLPAQRERAVGAGLEIQPVVGLLARAGQARVDADVYVGLIHLVHQVAAAVIVVGVLGRGSPLHVHARPVAQRHPRGAVDRADPPHQAARPLADLGGNVRVRGIEQPFVERIGAVYPLARRTRHVENGLPAVPVDDLLELLTDGLHRLVPRDALPAGVLALGIRALHGMVDAIGMVRRLDGRLRLAAAVTARLERRLIALHLDDATVLHGHPHAALHLAAAAATRAHALDVVAARSRAGILGQRRVRGGGRAGHGSARHGSQLRERTARQIELSHSSSFSVSSFAAAAASAPAALFEHAPRCR